MPLIQCPFFYTPSINQWGLYFLPLNLSMHVTVVVVTLGHKNTMPNHHNIIHFHLVLLRCPCLTQLPYCEEAQLAMQKNSSHGEDLRPPAYNSGRAASQEPAPPSPCEWAPFKVDPVASVEPTQLSLHGRMSSHHQQTQPKYMIIFCLLSNSVTMIRSSSRINVFCVVKVSSICRIMLGIQ